MEKEFIPYDLAFALKELGFNINCIATITNYGYLHIKGTRGFPSGGGRMVDERKIDCPTFSQVFRWFREKQFTMSYIYFDFDDMFCFCINRNDKIKGYTTYEEAELECLKKLIEIVKNK